MLLNQNHKFHLNFCLLFLGFVIKLLLFTSVEILRVVYSVTLLFSLLFYLLNLSAGVKTQHKGVDLM